MRIRTRRSFRPLSRIVSALTTTVTIVATLIGLVLLVPGLLGFDRYIVTGASMSGTIERGSIVFTREVPVSALTVGDVITYLPPADSGVGHLVTHRITSIDRTDTALAFRTQGDANSSVDPWAFSLDAPGQARVEFAVPALGFVFMALADPATRVLVLGIPAGLVALFCVGEIVVVMRSRAAKRANNTEVIGTTAVSVS